MKLDNMYYFCSSIITASRVYFNEVYLDFFTFMCLRLAFERYEDSGKGSSGYSVAMVYLLFCRHNFEHIC